MPRTAPSKKVKHQEGQRLKALRNRLGKTQREMAKEFLVSAGAINQWERGERTVPGPVLRLIEMYEAQLKEKK